MNPEPASTRPVIQRGKPDEKHGQCRGAEPYAEFEERVEPQRIADAAQRPMTQPRADPHPGHESAQDGARRQRGAPEGERQDLRPGDLVNERGRCGKEREDVDRGYEAHADRRRARCIRTF